MNLLGKTVTRRAALVGSTAGLALATLGWWSRSSSPMAALSQTAISEAPPSATLATDAPLATEEAATQAAEPAAAAATAPSTAAPAGAQPVVPTGGAGLFDVDPDQSSVNQDPHVEVTSDVAALPLDMEF